MTVAEEQKAIERIKFFEPKDDYGYYLAYSGGKDSDCVKILAQLAGVKFEAVHNLTTVDAPETVQYVNAFDRMLEFRRQCGVESTWKSGVDVFRWWMGEDYTNITFEDLDEAYCL